MSLARSAREWQEWSQCHLAQELRQQEMRMLKPFTSRKFGNHLLQISPGGSQLLFEDTPIANKVLVHFDYPVSGLGRALVSRPDHLAIGNDQVDLVILHHVLEYAKNPHQILREAKRVLVSGGKVLILGFNPWSLWSLRKLFSLHKKAPWSGRYISQPRLHDWMRLLELKVEDNRFSFYKLPLSNKTALRNMDWLERWGQSFNCVFGSSYLMVARKQVAGAIPLAEPRAAAAKQIISFPVAGPTARNYK